MRLAMQSSVHIMYKNITAELAIIEAREIFIYKH